MAGAPSPIGPARTPPRKKSARRGIRQFFPLPRGPPVLLRGKVRGRTEHCSTGERCTVPALVPFRSIAPATRCRYGSPDPPPRFAGATSTESPATPPEVESAACVDAETAKHPRAQSNSLPFSLNRSNLLQVNPLSGFYY